MVTVLSQLNTVHIRMPYFSDIYHLCLGLTSCFFPSSIPIKILYAFLISL